LPVDIGGSSFISLSLGVKINEIVGKIYGELERVTRIP